MISVNSPAAKWVLTAALLIAPLVANAHHSATAVFDVDRTITKKGVLTKINWVNPHILLYMDVTGEDGKVTPWVFEGRAPVTFRRAGVTGNDFKQGLGQEVTIDGRPAKDGSSFGLLRQITFADGKHINDGGREQ